MPGFGDRESSTPEELRGLMREHGLSQAAVSEAVHVSEKQVWNWLQGRSTTPVWAIELIRCKVMLGMIGAPPG